MRAVRARSRGTVKDVIWSSRFRVHHRLAASYRNGRVFVMGDAAHVHSPAGGQGMNCGLVDACVLGQLLADVIRGRRSEAALDLYETLRRPAAASVLALAGRLTMLATMRGKAKRVARNALFWLVNRIGPAKRALMMNLSGLARQDLARLPPVAIAVSSPGLRGEVASEASAVSGICASQGPYPARSFAAIATLSPLRGARETSV